MFADLLPWPHRRAPAGYEHAFVRSVVVKRTDGRDPRQERFIFVCWLLIAVKHAAILWALPHYHLPFHPLWVNAPTWLLGTFATWLHYHRPDEA